VDTQRRLIEAGLNIARLNFSHGDHDTHFKNIESMRRLSKELDKPVAILQDLQGTKDSGWASSSMIRWSLEDGATYQLRYGTKQTDPNIIPIDYRGLVHDVKVGQRVMMDDGLCLF
jgi:pyruvate kinase